MRIWISAFVIVLASSSVAVAQPTRAFPEAVGYGAQALTTCNRTAGHVHLFRITTLADSTTNPPVGGWRWMIAQAAAKPLNDFKEVRFDVAGLITLTGRLDVSNLNCLYIAGQTAPGNIEVRNPHNRLASMTGSNSGHVVVRYLTMSEVVCGFHIYNGGPYIFDHISGRWAHEKIFCLGPAADPIAQEGTNLGEKTRSGSGPVRDVTFQNGLFYEALMASEGHPTLIQIAPEPKWPGCAAAGVSNGWNAWTCGLMWNIDLWRNAMWSADHRNPMIIAGSTVNNILRGARMVNNFIGNWRTHATQSDNYSVIDVRNNFYKRGPQNSGEGLDAEVISFEGGGSWGPNRNITSEPPVDGRYIGHVSGYIAGNVGPGRESLTQSNVSGATRLVKARGNYTGSPYPGTPLPTNDPSLICYNSTANIYDPSTNLAAANCKKILVTRSSVLPESAIPLPVQDAITARDAIFADVGNNKRLNCDGTWTSRTDEDDTRVRTEMQSGTNPYIATQGQPCMLCSPTVADYTGGAGCYGSPSRAGSCQGKTYTPPGRPTLTTVAGCSYSSTGGQLDGIPNEWKTRFGLNINTNYLTTLTPKGETYTEAYFNGCDPAVGCLSSGPIPPQPTGTPALVDYQIDEAPSGSAPTQLVDAGPVPLSLPITYTGGQPIYVEEGSGRGWDFATLQGGGGASVAVDGTKLKTALHGATKLTIRAVADIQNAAGASDLESPWRLALAPVGNTGMSVIFNGVGVTWTGFDWPTAGRQVIHATIDTTQAGATNRVRLYVNGIDRGTYTTGTPPAQNATLDLQTGQKFYIGNLGDLATSSANALNGRIYNVAIYPAVMSAADIEADYATLNPNDDIAGITTSAPTPATIVYVGSGSYASSSTSATITPGIVAAPQGQALAFVTSHTTGGTIPTWTFPAGWSRVTSCHQVPGNIALEIWKKADVPPTTAPLINISDIGLGHGAVIAVWRNTAGTVTGVQGQSTAVQSYVPPAVTTVNANTRTISIVATGGQNRLALQEAEGFTGQMLGDPFDTPIGPQSLGMADINQGDAGLATMPVWRQALGGPEAWCAATIALDLIQEVPTEPPLPDTNPPSIPRLIITEPRTPQPGRTVIPGPRSLLR